MPDISIIVNFYNQPERVLEQIAYWESLPSSILSRVEFVLVDDCSHPAPSYPATKLALKVFRIATDIPWNQPGARNLGTFNAIGTWALYFDIDQRLLADPMILILSVIDNFDEMTMYYFRAFNRLDPSFTVHCNTFLVNLEKFKVHGMYDEDFSGHYGYDDTEMGLLWDYKGGKRNVLADFDFFEQLNFQTTDLNRDKERNMLLAAGKVRARRVSGSLGTRSGILRFDWSQVEIRKPPVG
jgi:glycosyltransferase involved in cell wall biosynthesis